MSLTNHIAIVPVPGRSHVRLISQLGFNILEIHPSVCITFYLTARGVPMVEEDISLQVSAWKKSMNGRYRIKSLGNNMDDSNGAPSVAIKQVAEEFAHLWKETMEESQGEEGFAKVPCLVISDLFAGGIKQTIDQSVSERGMKPIPMLPFFSSSSLASHSHIRSTADGGVLEELLPRFEKYTAEGMSSDDAALKAFCNVNNRLLQFPDLPPMYDYEFTPQAVARNIDESTVRFMSGLYTLWSNADGGIYLAVPELEGEGLKDLAARTHGPVFGVGPQLNENAWVKSEEKVEWNPEEAKVFTFLDEALREHGPNSAAYISLGTSFWPTKRPEIIEWIVESLLAQNPPIPFVFATPTKDGKIEEALAKRIADSGRGLVVDWCPQVRVLQHDAVGMFLTHCGNGSLTESITAGVPIIALPFAADQPAQAAFYTTKHKCGYDLRELKSGFAGLALGDGYVVNGTKEAAMAELHAIWTALRGDNGKETRERVLRMKEIWHKSWTQGESRKAVESLSQFFE